MQTVTCPSCKFVNANATGDSNCSQCGAPLAEAFLQQTLDDLKNLTSRMRELNAPRKSFYSFNGFGTTLLDYRALPDGTYEATRWVIALLIPIIPLATYVIQPTSQEFSHAGETSRFTILGKSRLSPARIARTYLLAAIGLAPPILGFVYAREIDRVVHGLWAVGLMIVLAVWAGYIILYKLKNDTQAYKQAKSLNQTVGQS